MQEKLFEDMPHENSASKKGIVKLKGTTQKPLTKTQLQFNRLATRISNLKNEIVAVSEKLQTLYHFHEKEVRPEVTELGRQKIRFAHLLHEKRKSANLSAHLNEKLDELILESLTDSFYVVSPTEEDKKLFSLYNDVNFEEEEERQKSEMADMFSDVLFEQMGVKVDPEELKKENPDFDKLKEQFEQQINAAQNAAPKRKKSQRTIDKEKREQQKEALKQKSLRSIYLSLAKILHPDKETNETLKVEKEEYMKQVTVAYENKNLPELLELEIQWVNQHENQLENTPEEVLKIYIELLKEQVDNLKQELVLTSNNPIYQNISHLAFYNLDTATTALKKEKTSYIDTHKKYADSNNQLEKTTRARTTLIECIKAFYVKEEDYEANIFDDIIAQMLMNNGRR